MKDIILMMMQMSRKYSLLFHFNVVVEHVVVNAFVEEFEQEEVNNQPKQLSHQGTTWNNKTTRKQMDKTGKDTIAPKFSVTPGIQV